MEVGGGGGGWLDQLKIEPAQPQLSGPWAELGNNLIQPILLFSIFKKIFLFMYSLKLFRKIRPSMSYEW